MVRFWFYYDWVIIYPTLHVDSNSRDTFSFGNDMFECWDKLGSNWNQTL